MGAVRKRAQPGDPWGPPTNPREHCRLVTVDGCAVPVLSLEYEAQAYEAMGRIGRADLLRSVLAQQVTKGELCTWRVSEGRTDPT